MHASHDVRMMKCFDGLFYSFAMLDIVNAELHTSCAAIRSKPQALNGALWRCWSFVDLVHRIREIAQAVPGLSRKSPAVVKFLESTELAESFRHYIQHLRTELLRTPGSTSPVWGSLAWVDATDATCSHTAIFGVQLPGVHFDSCVYDQVERAWVSRVVLATSAGTFNFDPIYRQCVTFRDHVLPWIRSTYKGEAVIQEHPWIVSSRFTLETAFIGSVQEPHQTEAK